MLRSIPFRGQSVWLLLCVLIGSMWSTPATAVTVTIQVAVGEGVLNSTKPGAITAELRWLGEDRVVPLKQTPTGVWQAVVDGPQVRALGVELWRVDGNRPIRVSQGLEIMPATSPSRRATAWSGR